MYLLLIGCYGSTDHTWTPHQNEGVTSGTVDWTPPPQPPGPPPPPPPPAPFACKTAADCMYNGVCSTSSGVCSCTPQFKGPRCGQFNFAPVDLAKGTGLKTVDGTGQQVSSWGGSVHIADDGRITHHPHHPYCLCLPTYLLISFLKPLPKKKKLTNKQKV